MKHKIASSVIVGALLSSSAAVTVESGCRREVEEKCVPLDPSLDYDGPVQRTPYCQWGPGEIPRPPEGYAETHLVSVAFKPTDDEPCDPCDVERFEALLHEKVATLCSSLDYTGLSVACYRPPVEERGNLCWVNGIYFSNFDRVPFDHGCHRCLPGESLCDGPLGM